MKWDYIILLLKTLQWLPFHVASSPAVFLWSARPCIIWPPAYLQTHLVALFPLPTLHHPHGSSGVRSCQAHSCYSAFVLILSAPRNWIPSMPQLPRASSCLSGFHLDDTISEWDHSPRPSPHTLSQIASHWLMCHAPLLISNSLVLSPHFTLRITQRMFKKKWPGSF